MTTISDQSLKSVLLEAFAVESAELLARLVAQTVQCDRGTTHPNEILRQMSITLHTLSGASATVGLETVSLLCQALEDFVDELSHGNRSLDRPAIESLRRAFRLLDDACRGGPSTKLVSVLHNLRITPGWQPHGIVVHGTTPAPAAPVVTDSDVQYSVDSMVTASPARPESDERPAALDAYARAVQFQFTALHAVWRDLYKELSGSEQQRAARQKPADSRAPVSATALAEFSAQLDAAMGSLHDLTEEIVHMHTGSPSTGVRSGDAPMAWPDDLACQRKRILVVDDSRTARIWMRDILEAAGYTVYVATDGLEALELILSLVQLDLLVTDLKMPRMDGTTLCHKVRSHTQFAHMPIVIVTSQSDDSTMEAGLHVGADAYIVKQNLARQRFLQTVGRLLS